MKGFTLIETIIYTVLVGIIMATLIGTTRTIFNTQQKAQAHVILEENINYAMERMLLKVRTASDITPTATGTASTLTLIMPNQAQSPTIFSLTNGTLQIQEGVGASVALTGSHIMVTTLSFSRIAGNVPTIRVRIEAQLRNRVGAAQATELFDRVVSVGR